MEVLSSKGVGAEAILVGVRLFFDSLMMRGVVKYNQPPALGRQGWFEKRFLPTQNSEEPQIVTDSG